MENISHSPPQLTLILPQLAFRIQTGNSGVESFYDIAKDKLSQERLKEKNPPYLMMLFQRSRALMMIIIIINGTARELTNNGEQMIPSWLQEEKTESLRLQKIKQILSWQVKTQTPQPETVRSFCFLCGKQKV
jgi:hypothetical protein